MPTVGGIAGDQLRSYIERIERIEQTIREEQEARKEVYSQAKTAGFDVKIVRRLIRERRMDKDDLAEEVVMLDLYRRALGGWEGSPLGEYAEREAAE